MKYFIDTEFHEFKKKPFIGKAIDTIELISIGLVSNDGREYYAISKDFDVKTAWENEWLRENVIQHLFTAYIGVPQRMDFARVDTYKEFKKGIEVFGKSNKQIAEDIFEFVNPKVESNTESWTKHLNKFRTLAAENQNLQFYGYYSDYDWVVFCWLFGRMIDLPMGFPMYCIDLKQTLDEKVNSIKKSNVNIVSINENTGLDKFTDFKSLDIDLASYTFEQKLQLLKHQKNYPKQTNEHNSLSDAKWNFELYKFLQTI